MHHIRGDPLRTLLVPAWWDRLVGRSETPLNQIADPQTVEELQESLRRIEQRHQRELMELRAEWGETLDKLTSLANRASARQRKRSQRELAELEDDDEPPARPPTEVRTPPEIPQLMAFNPRDKGSIRAHLRARNGGQ